MKLSLTPPLARALVLAALAASFSQCSVSDQARDTAGTSARSSMPTGTSRQEQKENRTLEEVQYRLDFIDEARLGGQDILFMRQASDLSAPQQARLQAALQAGNLPLRLRMRIYARNPAKTSVQLQQLDYQLYLDGRELTTGSTPGGTVIEPSASITLPVAVDMNVAPTLVNGATPLTFAAGLADFTKNARRLELRVRPVYQGEAGRTVQPTAFVPVELITAKKPKR